MKKVFSNFREVCHIWAADSQDEGRSSNMSFNASGVSVATMQRLAIREHSVIYSYRTAMGMILNMQDGRKVLLLNRANYSPTTTKHQSAISNAVHNRHFDLTLEYPGYLRRGGDNLLTTWQGDIDALAAAVESDIMELLDKASRARKNADLYRGQAARLAERLKAYADFMQLSYEPPALDYAALKAKAEEAERREAERRAAAERERIAAQAEHLAEWMAGGDKRDRFSELRLRVKGDEVETTHGARIPLQHAINIWPLLSRWKAEGKTYSGPVNNRTLHLGPYAVESFDGHVLKVGCHLIPWVELERIAGLLGLADAALIPA